MPSRLATRQRLVVGTLIVMGASLLNLIALEIGPFGSLWPIALLWPVVGWAGLGPNVTTASLLFMLGFWVDALTGAPLGTWAFVALVSHGLALVVARFIGTSVMSRVGNAALGGVIMAITMILFGLWHGTGFYVVGIVWPLACAIGCYHFIGKTFELKEDEA